MFHFGELSFGFRFSIKIIDIIAAVRGIFDRIIYLINFLDVFFP